MEVTPRMRSIGFGPAARAAARILVILTALAGLSGCSGNLISTKQEVKIGQQAARQVEQEYIVDTSSEDAVRVRRLGERLLPHSDQRPGVPYTFSVIDRDRRSGKSEVNAVSLPGGPVYVFRGLIDVVGDDDDALACVIGHEIGHINARHITKQYTKQQELGLALGVILQGQSELAYQLANLGFQLTSLQFSRDDEYEADRRGLSYAYKAGFDPNGMIRFFQKLATLEKGGGSPEFLRTHPVTKSRIARAQAIIEKHDYRYGQ